MDLKKSVRGKVNKIDPEKPVSCLSVSAPGADGSRSLLWGTQSDFVSLLFSTADARPCDRVVID